MKKILVPTDFSENAATALDMAVQIAENLKFEIEVIHVMSFPFMSDNMVKFESEILWNEITNNYTVESENKLKKLIQPYVSRVNISKKVIFGSVTEEVLGHQIDGKFSIMVLGDDETFDLGEQFFGTLTDKLVHKSNTPVLVVKRKTSYDSIKKAVFGNAINLKEKDLSEKLKMIQSFFDIQVEIVRINTPYDFMSEDVFDERIAIMKKVDLTKGATFHTLNFKNHGDGLIYYASKSKAGLIVIGDKHRSTIRRWFIGEDLAMKVIDFSNLPVLIL